MTKVVYFNTKNNHLKIQFKAAGALVRKTVVQNCLILFIFGNYLVPKNHLVPNFVFF